jgi:hypothetical protein
MYESRKHEKVCVTFTVEEWAKVIASVATSRLNLTEKEHLNSTIYDSCLRQDQRLTTP